VDRSGLGWYSEDIVKKKKKKKKKKMVPQGSLPAPEVERGMSARGLHQIRSLPSGQEEENNRFAAFQS
jgi:hypothetical protein